MPSNCGFQSALQMCLLTYLLFIKTFRKIFSNFRANCSFCQGFCSIPRIVNWQPAKPHFVFQFLPFLFQLPIFTIMLLLQKQHKHKRKQRYWQLHKLISNQIKYIASICIIMHTKLRHKIFKHSIWRRYLWLHDVESHTIVTGLPARRHSLLIATRCVNNATFAWSDAQFPKRISIRHVHMRF